METFEVGDLVWWYKKDPTGWQNKEQKSWGMVISMSYVNYDYNKIDPVVVCTGPIYSKGGWPFVIGVAPDELTGKIPPKWACRKLIAWCNKELNKTNHPWVDNLLYIQLTSKLRRIINKRKALTKQTTPDRLMS